MTEERLARIALHFIPGVGDKLIRNLISFCGSAKGVLRATKGKLLKVPGIGPVTADMILKNTPLKLAEAEVARCEKAKAHIILFTDPEFPKRLKQIHDAPTLLYTQGNTDLNTDRVVAVVGTRKATSYGREMTAELIAGLAPYRPLIISGLAYGIDIQAHKTALDHGLPTVGVMASGINIIYPKAHRTVALSMAESGALITENPFDSKPDPPKFPARNRIIAGMSDLVVVAEASEKGGALITAEIANSYNRDVFAVPGRVGDAYSAGCNTLIKTHKAHLIQSAKDIAYTMNWEVDSSTSPKSKPDMELLDDDERSVVVELETTGSDLTLDTLSWKTRIPLNKLASILLNLEFAGHVVSLPGKRYSLRIGRSFHN